MYSLSLVFSQCLETSCHHHWATSFISILCRIHFSGPCIFILLSSFPYFRSTTSSSFLRKHMRYIFLRLNTTETLHFTLTLRRQTFRPKISITSMKVLHFSWNLKVSWFLFLAIMSCPCSLCPQCSWTFTMLCFGIGLFLSLHSFKLESDVLQYWKEVLQYAVDFFCFSAFLLEVWETGCWASGAVNFLNFYFSVFPLVTLSYFFWDFLNV